MAQGRAHGASTRSTTATLYVAKFHADGTGEWLPLTPGNPALADWTLNDILINTRTRGRRAPARRRWTGPSGSTRSPTRSPAIATLTNNSAAASPARTPAPASPTPASTPPTRGRRTPTATSSAGTTRTTSPSRPSGGTSSPSPATPRPRPRVDDRRRQVRLARRPLRRAERPAVDPDRRVGQHDQHRRLRRVRQQPDAVRRSRRPRETRRFLVGPAALRGHRRVRHARRADDVRRASSTPARRRAATTTRRTRSSTARGRTARRRAAALVLRRRSPRTTAARSAARWRQRSGGDAREEACQRARPIRGIVVPRCWRQAVRWSGRVRAQSRPTALTRAFKWLSVADRPRHRGHSRQSLQVLTATSSGTNPACRFWMPSPRPGCAVSGA